MSRPDYAAAGWAGNAAASPHGGKDYPRLEREAIQALAREEEAEADARAAREVEEAFERPRPRKGPGTRPCRWPGCTAEVPAQMWGCREHWYSIPKKIRDRIWATYRIGQEETLDPSPEWVEADRAAMEWAAAREAHRAAVEAKKSTQGRFAI